MIIFLKAGLLRMKQDWFCDLSQPFNKRAKNISHNPARGGAEASPKFYRLRRSHKPKAIFIYPSFLTVI